MNGYTCSCCGEYHETLPLAYGADAPAYWYAMEPAERDQRFQLSEETAVLDGAHFFVRGRLEIPVHDSPEAFGWGVWVTMSQDSFRRMLELWDAPDRADRLEPSAGWLSTHLGIYPETINLRARLHHRPPGLRPLIELEPTDHPLAVEQRTGITLARVEEIAAAMHKASGSGA